MKRSARRNDRAETIRRKQVRRIKYRQPAERMGA